MKPRQLQRLRAPLAALLALSTAARPAEAPVRPAADVAVPRTDENSRQAHADLLAKRGKGRIDLYFVGDSITRRWGAAEPRYRPLLEHWQKSFHGWNAADFAWGGDTTGNILWRLDNGELDGVNPRVIVVMAGTNNLARPVGDGEAMAADIARGIEAILRRCQALAPQARIVLMGITPRGDVAEYQPVIERVNARLARLADGQRVRFVDLRERMTDASGKLLPGMTDPDQLHLALPAYEAWAAALRPILLEWLGPPAAVDQAPPPTGDPSAMRAAAGG
ncbi:MAG: GDSL-type esterase/lipase family protein [Pseudomonadota bacterium]|nr:GDSL-type esterase/lipase family protein [Pseudomonadota bacterium]